MNRLIWVLVALLLAPLPAFAQGQVVNTELSAAAALADSTANPIVPGVASFQMCWSGSVWNRCTGAGADTELPSAVALADNTTNPTVPGAGAFLMCFDGTTWDRCQLSVDASHGTAVVATGPGIQLEAKDQDGSALPNTVTEGQSIRAAGSMSGITYTMPVNEDGSKTPLVDEDVASAGADLLLKIACIRDDTLDARSATEGDYEMCHLNANGALWTADVNSAAMLTALQIIDNAETGASHYAYTSAGTTEDEHVVAAAPATLWSITATNHAATGAFLRCENQDEVGDGAPGTDTLAAATDIDLEIPGATTGAGITFSFARGLTFSVGIKCWIVTGEAYSSVAGVGANDVKLLYSYK